jgi:hypothetical protein
MAIKYLFSFVEKQRIFLIIARLSICKLGSWSVLIAAYNLGLYSTAFARFG